MKKAGVIFKLTAFLFTALFVAGNSDAQNFTVKRGEIRSITEDRDEKGVVIKDKNGGIQKFEPSGVEPIGGGTFLLAANDKDFSVNGKDTGLSLKIVRASDGRVIKTLSEQITGSIRNPKWEALAKDADGNYYVIGSHNDKDLGEKLAAKSRLFRFRLSNESETDPMKFSIDMSSVRELSIRKSLTALNFYNPEKNLMKIEGLAVGGRGREKKLFIGLREDPSGKNIPTIFSGKLTDAETANGDKKKIPEITMERMFRFDAETPAGSPVHFQLSSLEYVEKLKGFLILTSTEQSDTFFGNALWFVGDDVLAAAAKKTKPNEFTELSPKDIFKSDFKDPGMKAEGIAVVPSPVGKTTRIVIVYDNDGLKDAALEISELIDNKK